MRMTTPPLFKFYCRTCVDSTWHVPTGDRAECRTCRRTVLAAEIVVTYAVDDFDNPARLVVPNQALPPYLRPVYIKDDDAPYTNS